MNKRMLIALALLGTSLVGATWAVAQALGTVVVWVTLEGRPVDAKVIVRSGPQLVGTFYNTVSEPGRVPLGLPPGEYTLIIDRGAGFHRAAEVRKVTVQAGTTLEVRLELEKGFSPARAWGYYCADLHAHSSASEDGATPPDELVAVLLAADLDIGFLSDHNTTKGHPAFVAAAANRGFPVILGIEITAVRWHWNAFPVTNYTPKIEPMVMLGVARPTSTFAEARAQGAQFIMANHPYWAGAPYFTAIGTPNFDPNFELVEIMNSVFSDDDERTIQRLFQFWNEGRRYVAVATSDDHDWKDPSDIYGWPRTYAYVEGPFTVQKWLEALGKGRAFATYGPLVNFTAQGSKARPGDTVVLTPGQEVRLEAEIVVVPREGPRTLKLVQVIKNGQVLREYTFTTETRATLTFADVPGKASWYILRVFASDGDQAFTNPIWVEVR